MFLTSWYLSTFCVVRSAAPFFSQRSTGFPFSDYLCVDFCFKSAFFDSSECAGELTDVVRGDYESADAEYWVGFVSWVVAGYVGAVVPKFVEVSDVHFSS